MTAPPHFSFEAFDAEMLECNEILQKLCEFLRCESHISKCRKCLIGTLFDKIDFYYNNMWRRMLQSQLQIMRRQDWQVNIIVDVLMRRKVSEGDPKFWICQRELHILSVKVKKYVQKRMQEETSP